MGEMAQPLRALTALTEDLDLVSITYIVAHKRNLHPRVGKAHSNTG